MRGLEVVDADFGARDVRGDRQHGHAVAVRVEQAIDQMEIARTATAGADGELPGEVGFGAGGKGGAFFVANVDPLIVFRRLRASVNPFSEISNDAIDALHAGLGEGFGHVVCCGPAHPRNSIGRDARRGRKRSGKPLRPDRRF